jgi:hypothetical protein
LNTVADEKYNFVFRAKDIPIYEPTSSGVSAASGFKFDGLRLEGADGAIALPATVIEHAGQFNAVFDDGVCFIAAHHSTADEYKLYCVDVKSERITWSADVLAASHNGAYTGSGFHAVSLSVTSESLIVFGAATDCAYAEAFARSTGECKFRFSTTY